MKKYCHVCLIFTTVIMSGYGVYFCQKCGHQVHAHEPAKAMDYGNLNPETYTITSSGVAGTTSLSSISTTTLVER